MADKESAPKAAITGAKEGIAGKMFPRSLNPKHIREWIAYLMSQLVELAIFDTLTRVIRKDPDSGKFVVSAAGLMEADTPVTRKVDPAQFALLMQDYAEKYGDPAA